jgi:SAM-dependent methyltransferase
VGLRGLLRRLGLLGAARWARAQARVARAWPRNRRHRRAGAPDGLPLPPGRLILQVAGTPDVEWYLQGGALAAESIREALARHGRSLEELGAVLDFGCGCGRVVRHWAGLPAVAVHGCDVNPGLVAWCRRRLPFATFRLSGMSPPLPYADGAYGLVYALSVFTHLPAEAQQPWIRELRRVLRPGGYLLLSVHGRRYLPELAPHERQRFERGELVVRHGEAAGSNLCGAYHPEAYVRRVLAEGLSVLEVMGEGARGNPHQDLVVLQKA